MLKNMTDVMIRTDSTHFDTFHLKVFDFTKLKILLYKNIEEKRIYETLEI